MIIYNCYNCNIECFILENVLICKKCGFTNENIHLNNRYYNNSFILLLLQGWN